MPRQHCQGLVCIMIDEKGVPKSNIIFLNLISFKWFSFDAAPFQAAKDFRVIPGMGEFGDRYFGTNDDDEQVAVSSQ
ncbi:Uridine kinase-like protein 4 [Glycine soja]|uniref:Uridine kinase-like protein 4 n=1 Tax=Glycine soja TaxID=3848 RepID=A0A445F1W1_GLYSO|nr:Uridine kinase-like protein 4 [Glycine soja]